MMNEPLGPSRSCPGVPDLCEHSLSVISRMLEGVPEPGGIAAARQELGHCLPCAREIDMQLRFKQAVAQHCAEQAPISLQQRISSALERVDLGAVGAEGRDHEPVFRLHPRRAEIEPGELDRGRERAGAADQRERQAQLRERRPLPQRGGDHLHPGQGGVGEDAGADPPGRQQGPVDVEQDQAPTHVSSSGRGGSSSRGAPGAAGATSRLS